MSTEALLWFGGGIELVIIFWLGLSRTLIKMERDIAQSESANAKRALADYRVDKPMLLHLIKQAKQLNWDLGIKPTYDDQTKKLLALANDPHANPNEARNAALQACKRINKLR